MGSKTSRAQLSVWQWLAAILFFAHFVAFNVWWLLGPYGPIEIWRSNKDLAQDIGAYLIFGTFTLSLSLFIGIAIVLDEASFGDSSMNKARSGQGVRTAFKAVCWGSVPTFLFFLIGVARSGKAFASGFPLERFLTFREITIAALVLGFFVFYSTFYFRSKPLFLAKRNWSAMRTAITNALNLMIFLVVSVVLGFCAVLLCQVAVRGGCLGFESAAGNLMGEVHREYGPGLSRNAPYSFGLMFFLVCMVALWVYIAIILPYRLSSRVLDWLLHSYASKDSQSMTRP